MRPFSTWRYHKLWGEENTAMRLKHQWWSGLVAVVLGGLVDVTAVAAGEQFLPMLVTREGAQRLDIIGFKCCPRSAVIRKLEVGDDKKRGDCASRTQSPSRDPRCLL